jgi:predicted nucleic acid-binding protein
VTRCYLDTNFLYAYSRQVGGQPDQRVEEWRQRVDQALGDDPGVISGLVYDELVYRSILAWLRDAGDRDPLTTYRESTVAVMQRMRSRLRRLWDAVDSMGFDYAVTDRTVTRQAVDLMSDPGLAPRDAFHAAHALDSGCSLIVSSDPDYDRLSMIHRLAPPVT